MLPLLMMPGSDPLGTFSGLAREYGDLSYFRLGGERVFFVNHPDLIKQVLVTDGAKYAKGRALERARRLLGNGLLTADATTHARRRPLVQPAFHRPRIAEYAATMVEHAAAVRDSWRHDQTVDVASEMMRLTLGIAARTLLDVDIASRADAVGAALTRVLESFWITLLPFSGVVERLPIPAVTQAYQARVELDTLILRMVAERRHAGGAPQRDILSMLVLGTEDEAGGRLSDQEVRDEILTLLLAGHETTANALTWTCYLLSQSSEARGAVEREIDEVLGAQRPTATAAGQLPVLTRSVTEAMRLYPPAWVIGRRALVDAELSGYRVPAGAMVFVSPWVMHRDPRFFPRPARFEPERWTPEFRSALPRYAYFPFGGGARHCIGEPFAWMELVLVLATLLRRWRLELSPGHPIALQPLITLRPKHGMRMVPVERVRPQ